MNTSRAGTAARATLVTLAVLALLVAAVAGIVFGLRAVVSDTISNNCRAEASPHTGSLAADQTASAALITGVGITMGMEPRALTVALATAMQESKLRNIDHGDRDSVGLFQQRPSQGWGTVEEIMDPIYSTTQFYEGLNGVADWQEMTITEAAQEVQRSAYPEAYARHEEVSRAFAASFLGQVHAALTCRLEMPDDDVETDQVTSQVAHAAMRERNLEPEITDGVAVFDAQSMDHEWSVAHWAVGTAVNTDVVAVATGGQVWLREDGNEADWRPISEAEPEHPRAQAVVAAARAAGAQSHQVFVG